MRIVPVLAVLSLTVPGLAQNRPGGGQQDPEQALNRLMERDTNSDGSLSKDEVAGTFLERSFDTADADKNASISREEARAFLANRPRGPGGGAPGGGPGGGGPGSAEPPAPITSLNFHQAMETVGRSMRALSRAIRSDAKVAQAGTENLLTGLMAALSKASEVNMSDAARAKFGDDQEAFQREMKRSILGVARAALDLEEALLDNKTDDAAKHMQKMIELRDTAHNLYQEEKER